MSLIAMTWVFRHSTAEGGPRLVLLALADTAHDDGGESYPSVDTLALKARLSRRAVQYALRKLEADGHIENDGISRRGTTIWRITMGGGAKSAPVQSDASEGRKSRPLGVQPVAPEPKEPSVEPLPLSENSLKVGPDSTSAVPLGAQLVAHEGSGKGEIVSGEIVELPPPRFGKERVPASLLEDARKALSYYCQKTGQNLKPLDALGQPTESLKRIIGAMRKHPEVRTIYGRMIDHNLMAPWWQGDPTVGAIFGPGSLEQCIHRASRRPMPGASRRLTPAGEALRALRLAGGESIG